ncbi:MAG: aldehyde dehydrogenase family protein, partial [Calditrichaeota bacterium]|nr:aldehyde dehydrogenase family protein [Calditrichota bacterium]
MGQTITSINPRSGETIAEFPVSDQKDVDNRIKKLQIGQKNWSALTVQQRLKALKTFRKLLISEQDQISAIIASEIGKSEYETLIAELLTTVAIINDLLRHAGETLKTKRLRHRFLKIKKSYLLHEPVGIVAVISPWNYPFLLALTSILSALVAGNAVIYKPSEYSSSTGKLIADLIKRAGFPEDIFQIVYGDAETGKAIVNADINKICFTGSVNTGKSIAESAAKRLIPFVLELGGKDPMLVLADADLRRAARSAIWSSTFNGGQTCAGIERIIVVKDVFDRFLTLLKSELDQLDLQSNKELSPITNEKQFKLLEKQLKEAEKSGCELYQKELPESFAGQYKIPPTLIIKPDQELAVVRDESFGPIMTVESADSIDDAVNLANCTEFGLSACIFTNSKKLARQ